MFNSQKRRFSTRADPATDHRKFAELSIASDLDGFRSRIFVAHELQQPSGSGGQREGAAHPPPQFETAPTAAHSRGECAVEGRAANSGGPGVAQGVALLHPPCDLSA